MDGSKDKHPLVGQVLGDRYRIDSLVGEGGMGAVFRATHLSLERAVAVKVLRPAFGDDSEVSKRFDREALAVSKLDHPNCVQVIDFGTTRKGMKYLVMQLLEGKELRDLTGFALPVEQAVDLGTQILRALEHAHKKGLVHRDLKPENIFIVRDDDDRDVVKLVDFGIVKLLEGVGQEKLTRMGMAFGTPAYMSPEQAAGGTIDTRTDLYAVGVLLYEMLTGAPPFEADEPGILLRQHILAEPPPLPETVPAAVSEVVMTLLAKEADDRYVDARAARKALAASLGGATDETRPPMGMGAAVEASGPDPSTDPALLATAHELAARAPTQAQAAADTSAEAVPAISTSGGTVVAPSGRPVPVSAQVPASAVTPAPGPAASHPGAPVVPMASASMSQGAGPMASASMSHGSMPMGSMPAGAYDPLAVSSSGVPRMPSPYAPGPSGVYGVQPPPRTTARRRSVVMVVVIAVLLLWVIGITIWLASEDDAHRATPSPARPDAEGVFRLSDDPSTEEVAAPAAEGSSAAPEEEAVLPEQAQGKAKGKKKKGKKEKAKG